MKKYLGRVLFLIFAFSTSVFAYTRYQFPSFYYNADMQMGKSLNVVEDVVIDGDFILSGSFTLTNSNYVDDLRVPVTSTRREGSRDPDFNQIVDDGAGSQGVFAECFDDGTEEELYFMAQIPHNRKPNSNLEPHTHWIPYQGTTGDTVERGLEYTIVNIDGTFGNTVIITGAGITNGEDYHTMTDLGVILGTGITESAMIMGRIFRNVGGTDDYGFDACLLEIDFHYYIDGFGELYP